jgi:MFS transporter, DHA2 family, multidrug resistance protein
LDSLSEKQSQLSMEESGAVGIPYLTAWSALIDAADIQPGETTLITGAGGAVGRAATQERREQFHLSRLDDVLTPLNPHVYAFLQKGQAFFMQRTGDPAGSRERTVQVLADLRQQQAASLAYFDVFWLCAALGVGPVILVLLMKRSVAEKGAPVGGE